MRLFATITLALFFSVSLAFSQQNLKIYNITTKQLQLMQQYQNADSVSRSKVFINSIYTPYAKFWNDYLGDANAVASWLDGALPKLSEWQKKNAAIDAKKLLKQLNQIAKDMTALTGYTPKGNWYIVYGPAWADLGGLGDFAMLIDLAHANNSSNEQISRLFPHELTHQIMTNVNKHKDTTALSSIIGEGFAVWMNKKYWKEKLTLAENLGYSPEELKACDNYLEKLKVFFVANKYSTNQEIINAFRNRNSRLNKQLPGAIGYYLGYRIIESYVQKNGENAWKDVFVKSPREIYENSGF